MQAHELFLHIQSAQKVHQLGLKYNEIVDDICTFYTVFSHQMEDIPTEQDLYICLFTPCSVSFEEHYRLHKSIYTLLTQARFDIFFIFLKEALTDPPASWWKDQRKVLNAYKPT